MIAYFKQAETHPELLTQVLKNNSFETDPNLEPNFVSGQKLVVDQEYTILELIEYMIVDSNNRAFDLLINNIDLALLKSVYADLGLEFQQSLLKVDAPTIISVKDYATFFRVLFNASYLSPEMSNLALEILTKTKFDQGLKAGVEENIQVAHKFGERSFEENEEKQLHDCGIVYRPNKPYLLCVMTRGNDFETLINNVKQISTLVYQELENY
jgi:beta-lactamase class A